MDHKSEELRSWMSLFESTDTMSEQEFIKYFIDNVIRDVVKRFGDTDVAAAREEFHNLLDVFISDGKVDAEEGNTWGLPDWVEQRMENGEYSPEGEIEESEAPENIVETLENLDKQLISALGRVEILVGNDDKGYKELDDSITLLEKAIKTLNSVEED